MQNLPTGPRKPAEDCIAVPVTSLACSDLPLFPSCHAQNSSGLCTGQTKIQHGPPAPVSLPASRPSSWCEVKGPAEIGAGGILVTCGNEATASYPRPRAVWTPGLAELLR